MEIWLKRICILGIFLVIIIGVYDIYNDYVLPKMYNKESNGTKVLNEEEYNLCQNAFFKYYFVVQSDVKNIKYFIPISIRDKAKMQTLQDILLISPTAIVYNVYKLANTVYKIEYSLPGKSSDKLCIIVKYYKHRNYYMVIYDEIYEKGKVD